MKIKIKYSFCLITCILCVYSIGVTSAQTVTQPMVDKIKSTHPYKTIAVHSIESFRTKTGKPSTKKIIIQSMVFKPNLVKNRMLRDMHPMIPEYGEMIWTITGDELPIAESDCLELALLLIFTKKK